MGDKATLAKARMELEEMYLGIPDESVDLTFQDLANMNQYQNPNTSSDHHPHDKKFKKPTNNNILEPISEVSPKPTSTALVVEEEESHLKKIPSLDFSKGLQQHHHLHHQYPLHQINENDIVVHPFSTMTTSTTAAHHRRHDHQYRSINNNMNMNDHMQQPYGHASPAGGHIIGYGHGQHNSMSHNSCIAESGFRHAVEMSSSHMGSVQTTGRRRAGIPHSKICTICSTYIYIFRHRCLVCGRVYCRQCVRIGMGEMTEGRKCIECLGRRFSQRYIQRAGEVGCFCSRYPSEVRQAELKWAEKGPGRTGERGRGRSGMMSSISRGPMTPRTPTGPHASSTGPNSFVMSPSYSPYTPTHHHFPF